MSVSWSGGVKAVFKRRRLQAYGSRKHSRVEADRTGSLSFHEFPRGSDSSPSPPRRPACRHQPPASAPPPSLAQPGTQRNSVSLGGEAPAMACNTALLEGRKR
ncbi:hypothetical protein ZWY2020_027408 [Hordeum vulgare]|nr:hypothetical protein ZWY2020_027408 [Hordeum vulgare]